MNTPVHIAERNHPRLGKEKMLLQPDSALPDGHEGDAEEETEDAAHLGDHGGGGVQELLLLHRGVPATKQITVNKVDKRFTWNLQSQKRWHGST